MSSACQHIGLLHRIARLEHLMERRPELLSSVMLRQNPHAVHEWHKRVKLFEGNPTRQILTYTEAVKTVDADKVCTSSWKQAKYYVDSQGSSLRLLSPSVKRSRWMQIRYVSYLQASECAVNG